MPMHRPCRVVSQILCNSLQQYGLACFTQSILRDPIDSVTECGVVAATYDDSQHPSTPVSMESIRSFDEIDSSADHNGGPKPDDDPATIQAQNSKVVDLRGRPVDKSRTGTWKAAPFINAINLCDFQASVGLPINLVPYLYGTMHQSLSKAATITTDYLGTSYLVAVLGGFLADSYLGSFYTICVGAIAMMLGFGLLTASTALSSLQPAACLPPAQPPACQPARSRYMAPFYVALYTIAFGTGLVKPNTISLGGDQFDDSNPKEKKQSHNFFLWFYFFTSVGLLIAFSLGVYLQDDVSRSWGYGFSLMLYGVCFLFFVLGVTKIRHKIPTGSFLTRTAQVLVASLRKRRAPTPANARELYSPAPTPRLSFKLSHTPRLRFLDRAAIVDEMDKEAIGRGRPDLWRLCSVTQVEETKRLIQLVPICLTTFSVTLVFSQMSTFVIQQGGTFDRNLGSHFTIPPASLLTIMEIAALICVPIYDLVIFRIARRFTKSPYGFAPLQRLGTSLFFACLTMVISALVERKRLTYVRNTPFAQMPLGTYVLPMKFWYLLPQLFCAAQIEFFLYVASYEFFYYESAGTTRSIGSSFTYTASALGYFFSTILVDITNHVTRNNEGGSWLKAQLNTGGLEKFYWLLAVFIGVNFIFFLIAAHFYRYKHDWYGLRASRSGREAPMSGNRVDNVDSGRSNNDI